VAAKSPATAHIVMGLTNPKFLACDATLALSFFCMLYKKGNTYLERHVGYLLVD
jgi:hypothetical protein